ncbi:MAG: hypothetical protein IPJ07_10070 [Acidobacteria bacterium]|nr:hypothetical protein [Acidobacteriota bacterium]
MSALLAMPVCKLAINLFTVFLIAGAGLAGNRSGAFQAFSQVGAAARQGSEAKAQPQISSFRSLPMASMPWFERTFLALWSMQMTS